MPFVDNEYAKLRNSILVFSTAFLILERNQPTYGFLNFAAINLCIPHFASINEDVFLQITTKEFSSRIFFITKTTAIVPRRLARSHTISSTLP